MSWLFTKHFHSHDEQSTVFCLPSHITDCVVYVTNSFTGNSSTCPVNLGISIAASSSLPRLSHTLPPHTLLNTHHSHTPSLTHGNTHTHTNKHRFRKRSHPSWLDLWRPPSPTPSPPRLALEASSTPRLPHSRLHASRPTPTKLPAQALLLVLLGRMTLSSCPLLCSSHPSRGSKA